MTAENKEVKETHEFLFLNGGKVFDELSKTVEKDSLQGTYFYTYIDDWNRSTTERLLSNNSVLLPFKNYSEKEWRDSFIPVKEKRIAVFYFPFPLDLSEEKSLRVLLKYDRW